MADITFQRSEYTDSLPAWEMVDDVCAGQRALKARDSSIKVQMGAATPVYTQKRYLPMPNPSDTSVQNLARYEQYLFRAVFYNATGFTLRGLIGTAFRKPPAVDLGQMEYLLDDSDGQCVGLFQQMQAAMSGVLKKGRYGIWVDYPATGGNASKAEMEAQRVQASIIGVTAEQIINWRTDKIGSQRLLSLVVIHEVVDVVGDDGYSIESVEQYRELTLAPYIYSLSDDGSLQKQDAASPVYSVAIYRKSKGGVDLVEAYTPMDGAGSTWEIIPFTFIGAVDNNPVIDGAPLYDLAELNLGHYRNSADYEDSAFFSGQAQPWISGLDTQWRDWLQQAGLYVGSRSPILLPENGAFGIAQAEPNTLVKEAMDSKERQMIASGARLIQKGDAVKTATQAQGEKESEHSVLSLVCENVSEAFTSALEWASRYMNANDGAVVEISRDFMEHTLDAQMLSALVAAWQGGALPDSDMWDQFRKVGLIDPEKGDDEIRGEVVADDNGLGLDAESGVN